MFDDYQDRMYNKMVFEAGLHNIDLNKEVKGKSSETKEEAVLFKSPEEYVNMGVEERNELTKQMLGGHKLKFS